MARQTGILLNQEVVYEICDQLFRKEDPGRGECSPGGAVPQL